MTTYFEDVAVGHTGIRAKFSCFYGEGSGGRLRAEWGRAGIPSTNASGYRAGCRCYLQRLPPGRRHGARH
jgi:hypothetical protein